MIDTHSHIQFKIFDQDRDEVIKRAVNVGVEKIIAVGTDIESSKKVVEIAQLHPNVYAAVGIHPHHVFKYLLCHSELVSESSNYQGKILKQVQDDRIVLETLLANPKVLAVGETGLDNHFYPSTKYADYAVTDEFLEIQRIVFIEQIKLAKKYDKTLIIHNRGQVKELLKILEENWDPFFEGRSVFHCCEPDEYLLNFAKMHQIFIGVDGDVTYDPTKQEFVTQILLELLVLETDSPFFLPHKAKLRGEIRNEPKNLVEIAGFLEKLLNKNVQIMSRNNASALFKL